MRKAVVLIFASMALGQTPPTFRGDANLVLVPVVVRDGHGQAMGNLTHGEFRLYDNGKAQNITAFSALHHATRAGRRRRRGRGSGGHNSRRAANSRLPLRQFPPCAKFRLDLR